MGSQSSALQDRAGNPSPNRPPPPAWYRRRPREEASSLADSDDVGEIIDPEPPKKLKVSNDADADPPSLIDFESQEGNFTLDFVKEKIEDFKQQKSLDKRCVCKIIKNTRKLLRRLPSLVDVTVPDGKHITVCGDLHGQFFDLLKLFEMNGLPSAHNPYIFNGDFVDRGAYSVEVILTLFLFKCMCPSAVHLTRGNHEARAMNEKYGFAREVKAKLDKDFVDYFADTFHCLPLAHVINKKILVVHGGVPNKVGVKLADIKKIDRFCELPGGGLMCELLWNDPLCWPRNGSPRGGRRGRTFSTCVTKKFLEDNNLELVVRSHEVKAEGYEIQQLGQVITVFSAPNYCGKDGNKGAFIRFVGPRMKPIFFKYTAAKSQGLHSNDQKMKAYLRKDEDQRD